MMANPQPLTETYRQLGTIHPATRLGHVHLMVAKLDNQIAFYQKMLGFRLHWREEAKAGLGAGKEDLLRLTEQPGARRVLGTTGLYHFAVLFPNRRELARAVARLFALHYPNYPTDHVITKTTYLDDPEGQNVELYADTPKDGMTPIFPGTGVILRADGTPSDGREPLDVEALFRELSPEDRLDQPMSQDTSIGHVHLYVADLETTRRFYHDLIGFDDMGLNRTFHMGMVSAGGYHHHIGFNTWVGQGAPPLPPNSLGMRYFTVLLPNQSELDRVLKRVEEAGIATEKTPEGTLIRDPSQNGVMLTLAPELKSVPERFVLHNSK